MTFLGVRQTGIPGIDAIRETIEREFTWGSWELAKNYIVQRVIDGASRDPGNTGDTEVLRPGLAMGTVTVGKKLIPWVDGAGGGSGDFTGFLLHTIDTQVDGTDSDQLRGWIIVGGLIKAESVIIAIETSVGLNGAANETNFKGLANVLNHIIFDDFDINLP